MLHGFDCSKRAHEHFIQTQRVRTIVGYDVVRINHVATALGHLVCSAVDANRRVRFQDKVLAILFSIVRLDFDLSQRFARLADGIAIIVFGNRDWPKPNRRSPFGSR